MDARLERDVDVRFETVTVDDLLPKDYVTAHMWLNLAGAQNHENARRARDHIRCDMNAEQITEAQQRARAWSPVLTR